jgi:SpoVK/Ycf46/Vps4 family AAA+-type ATPase
MSQARQLIALLKSHFEGDEPQFCAVAMQVAAHEARLGHTKLAEEMRQLIDEAKGRRSVVEHRGGPVVVLQPKGDLATLLSVKYPEVQLADLVLPPKMESRLRRILREHKQQKRLRQHALRPRRKLLFIGPPGSGKTMTAAALASHLHLPLFTILLEGLITKFMGETAAKLKLVFDAMTITQGVYLFDEFDAIGAKRTYSNDVGEIRRVLNSFLQLLEKDDSLGLIVAATNHPDLLDRALFRRFDDVIEYSLPDRSVAEGIMKARLAAFSTDKVDWNCILDAAGELSQAELVRACDESAKHAILENSRIVDTDMLLNCLEERKSAQK